MIDLKVVREDPDRVRASQRARGEDEGAVDALIEAASTSNCTTFQARRLGTRYRDAEGRPQIAATLNGTLATTRWIVTILENHQLPDGSVRVPAALRPALGGLDLITSS